MIRGADDDRVLALRVDADTAEERHDAVGRAGAQHRDALGQATHGVGMEAIHVLDRTDALDDGGLVDVGGQGELHQYAVDGRVLIEVLDERQELRFRRSSTGRS